MGAKPQLCTPQEETYDNLKLYTVLLRTEAYQISPQNSLFLFVICENVFHIQKEKKTLYNPVLSPYCCPITPSSVSALTL